mgnify:CR=1 FL=1
MTTQCPRGRAALLDEDVVASSPVAAADSVGEVFVVRPARVPPTQERDAVEVETVPQVPYNVKVALA